VVPPRHHGQEVQLYGDAGSALGSDKDSQQDPARNNQEDTGRDDYSIDPSPFDTVTQAISMAAKMRAYANTYPTDEKHTSAHLQEYGKFGNAILDMQSKKRDYIPEDMSRLINTGWLIKLFPFDPHLLDQNQFPFQIETLPRWEFTRTWTSTTRCCGSASRSG
jgi:hypothetical protein